MIRWTLLIALLIATVWAQSALLPDTSVTDFLLVYLLAGALFVSIAPAPYRRAAPAPGRPREKAQNGNPPEMGEPDAQTAEMPAKSNRITNRFWVALFGTLLALAATGNAAYLFWSDLGSSGALLLWGLGIVLLILAWWWVGTPEQARRSIPPLIWGRLGGGEESNTESWRSWEWLLLLAVGLVAFGVRWWDLKSYPFGLQSDESNNIREALKWLNGAPYLPYAEANQGQATLFTYLIALSFRLFGVDVVSMRYASIAVGALTVMSFYCLARAFFTLPVALFTTLLLAVSRWHITFSRIGYELILLPLALIWLYFCLYQGMQKNRRPRYFVLAGLAFAFGFNTYTAFRVAPLGILLFCLYWLIANWRQFWGNLARLLLFAVSTLVGLLPLAIYTIQRPNIVLLRTAELSIWGEIERVGSWDPLWHNLHRYSMMFNVLGDQAALNNLPGERMLNNIVAALFLLGLSYALWHWRNPKLFLMLTWVLAVLPAGILSVTVETPSARRVIGLLPLVFLLVGVVADVLRRATQQTWRNQLPLFWPALAAVTLAVVAGRELKLFFKVQAQNMDVRRAFNIEEWSVGQFLASLKGDPASILLDPRYVNNGVVEFAAHGQGYTRLDEQRDIPLQTAPARDLVYIFRPISTELRPLLEQFYPQGIWEEHSDAGGMLLFYTFSLSKEAQQQAHGVVARYYTPGPDPVLLIERVEPGVGSQPPPLPPPFTVEWSGLLLAPQPGNYRFALETTDPFTLTLDNRTVLTSPLFLEQTAISAAGAITAAANLSATTPVTKAIVAESVAIEPSQLLTHTTQTLYAGLHALKLSLRVQTRLPHLTWQAETTPATSVTSIPADALFAVETPLVGLIGAYFDNPTWQGAPVQVRHDLMVSPSEVFRGPYSVIWKGKFWAPADGLYTLGINSDDGAQLFINGAIAVDNGGAHGAQYRESTVSLSAGLHDVELRYFQSDGSQTLELFWNWPDGARRPLPLQQLLPFAVDVTDLVLAAQPVAEAPATPQGLDIAMTTLPVEQVTVWNEAGGGLAQPHGVAVAPDGRIYVADTGNKRLLGLGPEGDLLFEQGASDDALQEPFDVGVDAAGQVYLLDPARGQVALFDADGAFLRVFNKQANIAERARGLYVTPEGEVWIAHTAGARLVHLNSDGELVQEIATPGAQPVDVLVDSQGNVYTTEVEKNRLLQFNSVGALIAEYQIPTANSIDSPHLAIDAQDQIYMTQPEESAVLLLTPAGQAPARWRLPSVAGANPKPVGIAVDALGYLWVTDVNRGGVWRVTPEQ